jgi:hypothetical protein
MMNEWIKSKKFRTKLQIHLVVSMEIAVFSLNDCIMADMQISGSQQF